MKFGNIISVRSACLVLLTATAFWIISCNKENLQPTPIPGHVVNPGAAQTLGDLISSDTSFSFYLTAVNRLGLLSQLKNENTVYTVFAPDNNAFRTSGIPDVSIISALPITSVAGIVQYSLIPGIQYTKSGISSGFPNMQLPTSLQIGTVPGTPLALEMTTFPTTVNGFWINNIPVTASDILCKNGVLHKTAAIVAPPSKVLMDMISADPDLTFFQAAVARADSGQTGLQSFGYLMAYPVTNMTVLVPNNSAFQQLIFGAVYAYLTGTGTDPATASTQATALSASPSVFSNPLLYGVLSAETVRGILAYHLLASASGTPAVFTPGIRVFSNNFAPSPSFYQTMVNSSVAIHPGILVTPAYTGPIVTGMTFTGMGTFPPGGQPFSGAPANAVSMDNAAVNGVYYVINKVLLPQ